MSMKIDFTDFDKKFREFAEKSMPENISKALFVAGSELIRDAIEESRGAPKDNGDLWASKRIQGGDGAPIIPTDNAPTNFKAKFTSGEVGVTVGFNIEYAAYQHEGQRRDGSHKVKWYTYMKGARDPGPKFLESKMVRYKNKYIQIAAEYLKRRLFKGGSE